MDVTVKTRFNCSKQRVENFGSNRYLVYLPFEQDEDSESIIVSVLSKHLGVPPSRVQFRCFDHNKDWVFNIS